MWSASSNAWELFRVRRNKIHGAVPNFLSAAIRTQVGAIWMADWAINWQHLALVARTGREKKAPKGGPTWAPDVSQVRDPKMGMMGMTSAPQGGPICGPKKGATIFAKNRARR